jgi:hypothetical protein
MSKGSPWHARHYKWNPTPKIRGLCGQCTRSRLSKAFLQEEEENKKEKQISINHAREGISCGGQPAGQVEASNRRGGGGGKARNTGARERKLGITITQNQSSTL